MPTSSVPRTKAWLLIVFSAVCAAQTAEKTISSHALVRGTLEVGIENHPLSADHVPGGRRQQGVLRPSRTVEVRVVQPRRDHLPFLAPGVGLHSELIRYVLRSRRPQVTDQRIVHESRTQQRWEMRRQLFQLLAFGFDKRLVGERDGRQESSRRLAINTSG